RRGDVDVHVDVGLVRRLLEIAAEEEEGDRAGEKEQHDRDDDPATAAAPALLDDGDPLLAYRFVLHATLLPMVTGEERKGGQAGSGFRRALLAGQRHLEEVDPATVR